MTSRTSRPSQSPASNAASHISAIGTRGRPITKLRTIDETAELFNTSTRTVRRTHRLGCTASAPPGTLRSHFGSGYRGIPRRESQRLLE